MDAPVIDPRAEALERVDGRFDVRVLEPSPPAIGTPPFFADDPVHESSAPGRPVVAPVPLGAGASTWDELVGTEPDLASWCADRWLGACRRLEPPADGAALVSTRNAWHVLAEHVLAPARHAANGKIGLRYTRGGVGTPFYGRDEQARLTADGLVVVRDGTLTVHSLDTPRAAATALGIQPGAPTDVYTPTTDLNADASLIVDAAAARELGDWFGFGASVLEALRTELAAADESARVQIWPEHFDLSVDFGDDAAGVRATYGASPGDAVHPEPYLYVSPWTTQEGAFWNEGSYASHPYAELVASVDQREAARAFFERARAELGA